MMRNRKFLGRRHADLEATIHQLQAENTFLKRAHFEAVEYNNNRENELMPYEVQELYNKFKFSCLQIFAREDSELLNLADKYGTDKGSNYLKSPHYAWRAHSYTAFYEKIFSSRRSIVKNVFECGIGTRNSSIKFNMSRNGVPGASLRMWRDYFKDANIYGADIDSEILFEEERIKTYWVDQTSKPAIDQFWVQVGPSKMDVIIDDGLHTFEGGSTLFKYSIEHLARDGAYIIEDVSLSDLENYYAFFNDQNYNATYVFLRSEELPLSHNAIIVVTHKI